MIESDKLLNHLKVVCENKVFRDRLDKLISSYNFSLKELKEANTNIYSYTRGTIGKIVSDINSLCLKYNIDKNAAYSYASFDKSVIAKLDFSYRAPLNVFLNLYIDNKRFTLHGSTCKKAFDTINDEVIYFLTENADLFPNSTKKFIKSKADKLSDSPKVKLKLLKNDFETKIFSNSLSAEPDTVFIKRYVAFLKDSGSLYTSDTVISLIFLAKALHLKYPDSDNKQLKSIKKSLFSNIFKGFANLFDYWEYHRDEKSFFVALDQILGNSELLDYFFSKFTATDRVNKVSQFFAKYAISDSQKIAAEKILINSLKKDMRSNVLKYEDCPSDLQKYLFEEFCKKDFYYDYDNINSNLKNL